MSEDAVRDFKTEILKSEYIKYSKYFIEFESHIEKCYNNHFINIIDRNNLLKILNDVIKQINILYNSRTLSIYESENQNKIVVNDIKRIKTLQQIADLYKVLGIRSMNFKKSYGKLFEDPFDNILNIILNKLATKIGFPSINLALKMIIGENYYRLYNDQINKLITLYDNLFISVKYSIQEIKDKNNNNSQFIIKKSDFKLQTVLQDSVDILILLKNNKYITFTGYFKKDPLNAILRTSQICNNYIFTIKKKLENFILSRKDVNDKFAKVYIRNASMSDIILLSHHEFYTKLNKDYNTYNRLNTISFMNLIKEFSKNEENVHESIKNMFNTVKLLLLGTENSVNNAGLLYSITKEKKPLDNDYAIADIIYDNLNYFSQIKLRKTVSNIKAELNRINSITSDDVDLKKQIAACKSMPDSVKKASLDKIEEMKSMNNEYYKQALYVKTLINYPWPSENEDTLFQDIGKSREKSRLFLDNCMDTLNTDFYGQSECKKGIKLLLGKWIRNPSSSGSAIGLVGKPGVGKTLIAQSIGRALNIPCVQITLGGQNDAELLLGHGYTYSSAQPGIVVKKMVEAGSARCIIYFDELDKASKKYDSNEIFNTIIHIIDPNTNNKFQDRFFQEVNFPVNKVLFIFSYNDSSLIDKTLMDRIKEIKVKPYRLVDKRIIANKFIIKEMCDLISFEYNFIKFSNDIIDFIINQYTHEPGVRELKRKFETIFLELNLAKIYGQGIFRRANNKPINITKKLVENYLGKQSITIQKIHTELLVGVINGLYTTDEGQGGILPIQILENLTNGDNKFTLRLTGCQKKVMRESVISAFTTAVHHIREDIRIKYLKNNLHGFHIHTPSGAVPKDGPSGGGAFACAFVSQILNKKIKNDIAITGEIELTGKITKIGGLQYKLPGAKRAGIKIVLVSSENKDDIEEIRKDNPELFDGNFEVILVTNLKDVICRVLIDCDPTTLV